MAETLNLANPKDSLSFGFKISRFPDGQQTVDLVEKNSDTFYELAKTSHITIKSRLNSFSDLELIICANQALKEAGVKEVSLYIPYCTGGRSDRKFAEGGINYVKNVIAPVLNLQNFKSVTVLDPHSDVLEACINNFKKLDNFKLIRSALPEIDNRDGAQSRVVLVSPDAGAYKKVFGVAQYFDIEKVITATKVRDLQSGKILRTEIPTLDQHQDLKYVIVDDICDGGRTFIELAKAIKDGRPTAKVYLIVTHGIFSAQFDGLEEYIDRIFTTNSVRDIEPGVDCPLVGEKSYVKQLNVF